MINLRARTEYSFRVATGQVPRVIEALSSERVSITDRGGCWGHVAWDKAARKASRIPLFGAELALVADAERKDKDQRTARCFASLIARSAAGLREIYKLVGEATGDNFYYFPRIDYGRLSEVSKDVLCIVGSNPEPEQLAKLRARKNCFMGLSPSSLRNTLDLAKKNKLSPLAVSDNYFPAPEDRAAYEVILGRQRDHRTVPMHLLTAPEWLLSCAGGRKADIELAEKLGAECEIELPKAQMVKVNSKLSLEQMCRRAAPKRGIELKQAVYSNRLRRELDLIREKNFSDYFFVIADLIHYAKEHMLVGPARGSSCGSLVCYLLSITEIDPIPYDLLFERFIDVNRKDLPDIDIDFPDNKRHMVFAYLQSKYGSENVARLGTIITYKTDNTMNDTAMALDIPQWEIDELKKAMIKRSSGDSRASFCILDSFVELDIGKVTIAKYPELRIAGEIEGHARQCGQHAAGIVVTASPVSDFCAVDFHMDKAGGMGVTQIDKAGSEYIDLLKIDALGLRTLSVIQDTLDQVGWTRERLMNYPRDDQAAFQVLNDKKYSGIFQFDGLALQSLVREMKVSEFEDLAATTALARPGPLDSGGAAEWIKRRMGLKKISYQHPALEPMTSVTYGVVVYQEQVMRVVREVGGMTWEETSAIRKAMSGRKGKEYFDNFWLKFRDGAVKNGVEEKDAKTIWDGICTFGSWAFNRSHAVAYGLLSYWTLVLKAHFPLEYAAACLRNARSTGQSILVIRELHREGFRFCLFDKDRSEVNWSVKDGELIGGLLNVKGIGAKKAEDIVQRRKKRMPLLPGQSKLLDNPTLDISTIFPTRQLFGPLIDQPERFPHLLKEGNRLTPIESISSDTPGDYRILGRIVRKSLRDHNELTKVQKRGGDIMTGQTKYLILTVEDDTGSMIVMINRRNYFAIAAPIVESGALGDYYMFRGFIKSGMRILNVEQARKIVPQMLNTTQVV